MLRMRKAIALRHRFGDEPKCGMGRALRASALSIARAACARPEMARPFQSARTLSSRAGCGRWLRTDQQPGALGLQPPLLLIAQPAARRRRKAIEDVLAFPVSLGRGVVDRRKRFRLVARALPAAPAASRVYVRPSSCSVSASRLEAKPPPGSCISRTSHPTVSSMRLRNSWSLCLAVGEGQLPREAARCRRASFRSAGPSTRRRRSSARNRRRDGRRCRPGREMSAC